MSITLTPYESGSDQLWLATREDVKLRIGIASTDTEHDDLLASILAGVSRMIESYCGRPLIQTPTDVTEYYTGCGRYLQLRRYPIIAITEIKEALDYDWDAATAMVADADYRLVADGHKGVLFRLYSTWSNLPDAVRVVYRGGYCPADATPAEGEHAVPSDLREAAIILAVHWFQHRHDLGLVNVSCLGGAAAHATKQLKAMAEELIEPHRRISL